ncbi:CASKIN2 [Branchiostoma lanceolatum]|uniref:chitin synthase n=1 Tax=Branchiostoma lanceolatum TaxID=7740 RepID=A0A8K0F2I7_BRALA|nr:CASKIN2 [Branchiostoma lanceolatum]
MATRRRASKAIELTLEKRGEDYKKKVEAAKTKEKAPPRWPGACKLLLSIVLFLVILSCLGFGKVSVISITQCLAQARFENRTYTRPSHNITIVQSCEDEEPEPIINMILLILMVPYGITLLRCVWVTGCRGVYPWPTWTAVGVGLLASTAEVFALGLFTIEALTTVKSALGILLMNSIYSMQIFFQLVYECYKFVRPHKTGERPPSWKKLLTFLLADCLGIAAFVTIVYFSSMEGNDPEGWWKVPLCVILISTAWSPVIQKLQTSTRNSDWKDAESSQTTTEERHKLGPNEDEDDVMDISKRKDGRLTSSLITSFWKLLLTPAVVTLYVWHYQIGDVSTMWSLSGWNTIAVFHPAFDELLVNIFCSVGAYVLSVFACSICVYYIGFTAPLLCGSIDAILLVYIIPACEVFIPREACEAEESRYVWGIPAAVGLYIAQTIAVWSLVAQSPSGILEKESQIFWLPGYNSIFLEQWLMLSRKTKHSNRKQFVRRAKTIRNACVYVCSTMYHESEEEMEQLLISLRGIANDLEDEANRHFESHIFFDGGCKQGQPSRWALQLMALIDKTMCPPGEVTIFNGQSCEKWDTPYGLQFCWTVGARKMSFNVHLKDNSKVRAKKRWSQVMYMSYVLDYLARYNPLGMSSGAILDDDIDASSPRKGSATFGRSGPHRARLNGSSCWTAEGDGLQYIEVDLSEPVAVTGLVVQGHPHANEWVKSFEIRYLDKSTSARNGETAGLGDRAWRRYGEGPDGDVKTFNITPTSGDDAVRVLLEEPIETRHLRIYPIESQGSRSMRFEILGHHIADNLENTYLLVTDADVKFTPEAAKALLDITARDPAVGAVCARTHPMGSGAVAWYQIFDYAIGHWLNKAANNVLGTVLCCPGCFSVYRAKAVRDGLAEYSTHVTKANEFLIKDMGEDRWFCTLLVESGWKLEYSAVSEDSTFCPETFDEFFKQRRRWLPSTVANLVLVVQKWKTLVTKNSNISRLFILYQLLLLFATLIGPGTCMLLIAGGMSIAYGVDPVISMVLLIITSVGFALLCLKTHQNVQLQIAKILTFAFAVVMAAVTVGTATDIVMGLSNPMVSNTTAGDVVLLPIPISTLYFFLIIAIFIVTALLHPTEIFCLFHGVWYLFCLPSGYLLLTIYSICNLNDRSWGTREGKTSGGSRSWREMWWSFVDGLRGCCGGRTDTAEAADIDQLPAQDEPSSEPTSPTDSEPPEAEQEETIAEEPESETEESSQSPPALPPKTLPPLPPKRRRKVTFDPMGSLPSEPGLGPSVRRIQTQKRWFRRRNKESLARRASRKHSNWRMSYQDTDRVGVEMWLPDKMREKYAQKFLDHGYDDTAFIAGMKESDLEFIGVDKMHRPEILRQIDKLSEYAIDVKVPDTVEEWLDQIGLEQYNDKFVYDAYDVASLVNLEEQQIRENLGIVKTAHVKRMLVAISHLRHPSETDEMIDRVKKVISDNVTSRRMQDLDDDHVKYREYKFWNRVRDAALKQDYGVFNNNVGLKEQLEELRNSWLIVLFVSNALWLTLILTLASQANLQVLDTNPLGLVFLVVFGFILIIQFLAMLVHRAWTVVHMLARIRNLWEKLDTEDNVGQKGQQSRQSARIPDAMPETSRRGFDDAVYQNEAFEEDGENPPVYESVSSF